jgi:hypothetical protein
MPIEWGKSSVGPSGLFRDRGMNGSERSRLIEGAPAAGFRQRPDLMADMILDRYSGGG